MIGGYENTKTDYKLEGLMFGCLSKINTAFH